MSSAMWSSEVAGRASPGLLRRRYSVPETIMRKYRLAQQRSDGEEAGRSSASPASSPARVACAWCGSKSSGGRRDRDPMRKSALLRLWGRAGTSPARNCACPHCGTRSLDGSHSELRSTNRCTGLRKQDERSDCTYDSHTRIRIDSGSEAPKRECKIDHNYLSVSMINPIDHSLTDSSETITTSMPTTKELAGFNGHMSISDHIDGRVSERSVCVENDDSNVLAYERPLRLETPAYDILEIVVSETLDVPTLAIKSNSPEKPPINKNVVKKDKTNIDIDQYVSNILVESLNSLTDQLESMNASISSDRKMSIVEKEIKVRLQNTGVNTIVHLSPTSNNQIIFGNEELYDSDRCNIRRDTHSSNIREEICIEPNNNFTSAESVRENDMSRPLSARPITDHFLNATADSVNKAVLQQIQKLFQEDLQNIDPEATSPDGPLPGVSHIEISNVDVFIDNNTASIANANTIKVNTHGENSNDIEIIGGIGPINYYTEIDNDAIVPRFSAFPHTESMEVNTSSSEDAEFMGSECASLVDSLDDPNSPRSILLRRSYNNKRSELVRSAIDVLDLLPDNTNQDNCISPKEKGEAFFIRIKDDDCDCEKENIVVADHMPETIKQRLFRRHRKRELRMECARRSRAKQVKRDLDNHTREMYKSKKELEKECMAVINALIDDVITKIAQDEYKCMRIKQRPNKISNAKSDENLAKRNKKDSNRDRDRKLIKNGFSQSCSNDLEKQHRKTERLIRGKFIPAQSPVSTDESGPKRIYQKSEIRDGSKCIEILEILEYVNSSQSSPETTNSDENHNVKNKKSRIPVPVIEKIPKTSKNPYKYDKSNGSKPPPVISRERNGKTSQLLANMLLESSENEDIPYEIPIRRASVPCESQTRSNGRFRNVFDIIPEERSSLSLESTGDDGSYNRRSSAPSINTAIVPEKRYPEKPQAKDIKSDTRSAGTSPMPDIYRITHNVAAMTSPIRKSAATSPIRVRSGERDKSNQRTTQKRDGEGSTDRRKSKSEDKIPTIRLKGGRSQESNRSNSTDRRSSEEFLGQRSKNRPKEIRKPEKERSKEKSYISQGKNMRERGRETDDDSSSSSSGGLLCSLAPTWLSARRRRRRATNPTGEWAVTVAGSCPAALPNDVEMRLRFPDPGRTHAHTHTHKHSHSRTTPVCPRAVDCSAAECQATSRRQDSRLTLTVKKEASEWKNQTGFSRKNYDLAEWLCEATGIDLEAKNYAEETVYQLACERNDYQIMEMVKRLEPSVNLRKRKTVMSHNF